MSLKDGSQRKWVNQKISDLSRINLTDDKDQIINKNKKSKNRPFEPMPKTYKSLELRWKTEAKNLIGIYASLTNSNLEKSVLKVLWVKIFHNLKKNLSEVLLDSEIDPYF